MGPITHILGLCQDIIGQGGNVLPKCFWSIKVIQIVDNPNPLVIIYLIQHVGRPESWCFRWNHEGPAWVNGHLWGDRTRIAVEKFSSIVRDINWSFNCENNRFIRLTPAETGFALVLFIWIFLSIFSSSRYQSSN